MQELFPPLSTELRQALAQLPRALERVAPLTAAHRRALPGAVEELSARLTCERGFGALPYWSAPRLTAAYLWYFLPWNVIRLARLLGGLDMPAPTPAVWKGETLPRIWVDVGSGPLTLPLALWLAKPEWRATPLTVLCLDAAPRPLELGTRLLALVAGEDSPWRVIARRAPLDGMDRETARLRGVPWLVSGSNVLNELKARPNQPTWQRLSHFLERAAPPATAPDASILLVEPGTRLGGKTMTNLRQLALEADLAPVQPCPHALACPLREGRTWCHFTLDAEDAPGWLTELSRAAGLHKAALSLSFMRLVRREHVPPPPGNPARIVSAPFRAEGVPGMARYACTAHGLALLGRAEGLPSGALVETVPPTPRTRRDAKSGAWILETKERSL